MANKPTTVKEYLDSLPKDRRDALNAIRKVILANIDKPFVEGIQYGMVGYYLPHSEYPNGYHCDPKQPLPFASIASNKKISLYLFCIYTSPEDMVWFQEEWKKTGKKLDMGKSCVRCNKLEDIPLDLIGKLFKRMKAKKFIKMYEGGLSESSRKKVSAKKKTGTENKVVAKKTAKKKTVAKKAATKKKSK